MLKVPWRNAVLAKVLFPPSPGRATALRLGILSLRRVNNPGQHREPRMSKKDTPQLPPDLDRFALERRRFLSEGAVYGAGAAGILASLGLSRYAVAQTAAAPAGGAGPAMRPGMPPMPPEPKVSQAAPLHDLKGK